MEQRSRWSSHLEPLTRNLSSSPSTNSHHNVSLKQKCNFEEKKNGKENNLPLFGFLFQGKRHKTLLYASLCFIMHLLCSAGLSHSRAWSWTEKRSYNTINIRITGDKHTWKGHTLCNQHNHVTLTLTTWQHQFLQNSFKNTCIIDYSSLEMCKSVWGTFPR